MLKLQIKTVVVLTMLLTALFASSAFAKSFSWRNATVYFVYVDRFENGDPTNDNNYGRVNDYGNDLQNVATFHGGDLKGLTNKLKQGYFSALGVNVIWITGLYEQIHGWVGGGDKNDFPHYGYHGYYPGDFTAMDKNYGTVEEFRTFVDLAHEQGIRIMMDAGINHPGYHTLLDAVQYQFGGVDLTEKQAAAHQAGLLSTSGNHYDSYAYLKHFEKSHHSEWKNWWGKDWIRSADEIDKDVLTESIFGLPDFKTEQTRAVSLPPYLKNKWQQEGESFDPWVVPATKKYRRDLALAPADYVVEWLSAWVEEFGIDGFRLDVLDNVDINRWQQLHEEANQALVKWRQANPEKAAATWGDSFWMTGDIWDAGIDVYPQYQAAGLDTIVNFTFPKDGDLKTIGKVWQRYADELNGRIKENNGWSTLSFLNNTYKRDTDDDNMINTGTTFLLAPGAVQIFYGDEVGRKRVVQYASDVSHGYRGDMVFGQDPQVLRHWQKLGLFRQQHLAVGAGLQTQIAPNTYLREYKASGVADKVIIHLSDKRSAKVFVGDEFTENAKLQNAYTGEVQQVQNGYVTFAVENSIVLIEAAN